MVKDTYNWKITIKKFSLILAQVIVAGTLVYLTDNALYLGLVPAFEAARNWLKHR